MKSLYLSRAVLACFDGEGAGDGAAGAGAGAASAGAGAAGAGAGAAGTGAGAGAAGAGDGRFTQDDLNRLMAEDRRKHEARYQAQLTRAQQALEEASKNQNLTLQEREQLAQQLEDMRKETRTKEQQLAYEKKQLEEQYEAKLKEEKKAREQWENRYREGTVERALMDAAVSGDAYDTDTMMAVLRPMTRLVEVMDEKTGKGTGKFEVKVDFPDTDPTTGERVAALHSPQSAVKRMKELPKYANLFKSGVVSGIGSNAATGGLASGPGGKVDFKNMTQEQYLKIRKENPALLGLRTQKGSGRR